MEFNDLVNKMTNHERNLWAKDKYPGLRRKDVKLLLPKPYAKAAENRIYLGIGRVV